MGSISGMEVNGARRGFDLITLTRPDGNPISVSPDKISAVEPDLTRSMNGNSIVRIDGENRGVMETADQILDLIKAAA
jgi:hypothetical protein